VSALTLEGGLGITQRYWHRIFRPHHAHAQGWLYNQPGARACDTMTGCTALASYLRGFHCQILSQSWRLISTSLRRVGRLLLFLTVACACQPLPITLRQPTPCRLYRVHWDALKAPRKRCCPGLWALEGIDCVYTPGPSSEFNSALRGR
jgi:hypothetical protein